MKKKLRVILIIVTLFTGLSITPTLFSQVPDPPGSHGSSSDESPGGGAPIGGGLFILMGLGAAYCCKKIYDYRKESLKD